MRGEPEGCPLGPLLSYGMGAEQRASDAQQTWLLGNRITKCAQVSACPLVDQLVRRQRQKLDEAVCQSDLLEDLACLDEAPAGLIRR